MATDSASGADAPDARRVDSWLDIARIVAVGVVVAIIVLSFTVPIKAAEPIVRDLAGKSTKVRAAVSISIGVTLVFTAGGLVGILRYVSQRSELRRLRRRTSSLEQRLLECQEQANRHE